MAHLRLRRLPALLLEEPVDRLARLRHRLRRARQREPQLLLVDLRRHEVPEVVPEGLHKGLVL